MDIRQKRRSVLGQPFGASSTSLKLTTSLHAAPVAEVPQPDERVKLVCVGDGAIGKTSLLSRYVRGEFPEDYVPTVFENYVKNTMYKGRHVELALWDTAGQEEYDRLRALSYPESNVIVLCYACDSAPSLENVLDRWMPEVTLYCPGVPVVLVGLKSDVASSEVTFESGQAIADKIKAYSHIWCSAKLGSNVQEVFDDAIRAVVDPGAPSKASTPAAAAVRNAQPAAKKTPVGEENKKRRKHRRCLIC